MENKLIERNGLTCPCSQCRWNRSGIEDIVVDGRTAAQYEDWGCAKEGEFTEDDEPIGINCRFFERCIPEEVRE